MCPMTALDKNLRRLTISLLFGCGLLATSVRAQAVKPEARSAVAAGDSAAATKALTARTGIWKAVVPPVKMNGTFASHDPIGLVAGKLIPADCSINWTDPDTHKLYCFSSATSLVYFLDSPQTYLAKAKKNWQAMTGNPTKAG